MDSTTLQAQRGVEQSLRRFLDRHVTNTQATTAADDKGSAAKSPLRLRRREHAAYLRKALGPRASNGSSLYATQPWLVYWALQAADLLGITAQLYAEVAPEAIAQFLLSTLSEEPAFASTQPLAQTNNSTSTSGSEGMRRRYCGFAGGPTAQIPHLASSYAACCALCLLPHPIAAHYLRCLPRSAIKRWLLALRQPAGSFAVHAGGEVDIRASYCAAVLVVLLQLDAPATLREAEADDVRDVPVLTERTARFVAACQTHEGGFTCSAEGSEAHGAYTHCGLAALLLMRQPQLLRSQPAARRWLAARQLSYEGGFNGRTNKLVDSCYSYWAGAAHVLLRVVESYVKCFPPIYTEKGSNEEEEKEEEEDTRVLRAREVFLLDHAQLLDMNYIAAADTRAWDAAEAADRADDALVAQFLQLDDESARAGRASAARHEAMHRKLCARHGCEDGTVHSAAPADVAGDYYFDQRRLQQYVLAHCQNTKEGGLWDKPGCTQDGYHTCYSLSGVSAAQNLQYLLQANSQAPYVRRSFAQHYVPKPHTKPDTSSSNTTSSSSSTECDYGVVLAEPAQVGSTLRSSNPLFNIHRSHVRNALQTWGPKTFL